MVNVEKVILHEKYQSPKITGKSSTKVQFDLAMLKVTRISRSGLKCSRPACLPKSHPEPGRRCFIAGRGDTGLNEIWLKFNNFRKIINLLFFWHFQSYKVDWSTYDFSDSADYNDTMVFDSYEAFEIQEVGINIMDGTYCLKQGSTFILFFFKSHAVGARYFLRSRYERDWA